MKDKKKKIYHKPNMKSVIIDNEISLIMLSQGPGVDPEEKLFIEGLKSNPFKIFKY